MAFFKVDTSEENVRDYAGGSAFINTTGIFDIILKKAIVDKTANGSTILNLLIEHQGQEQVLYQAIRMTNNDGTPNFGQQLFTKMCVVCGAGNGDEIQDPVSCMLTIGKDKEEKEYMVLEEFNDTPVKVRIQMEYSIYEGEIQQRKLIRNFYRYEDNATASEIVNNSEEKGKQYAYDLEHSTKNSYKDGLTEEEVQEWIKNKRSNTKKEEKQPTKPTRRTFGRKA